MKEKKDKSFGMLRRIRKCVKASIRKSIELIKKISPAAAVKSMYFLMNFELLDLKNPKTYHEKIQWLNVYWNDEQVSRCADKLLVRDYIIQCGCEEILNPLLFVYDHSSEIDWGALPDRFALKCNHGSGYNVICSDRTQLNQKDAAKKLDYWLKQNFGESCLEFHYNRIRPHILCESYIEETADQSMKEYSIYCLNGKAKYYSIVLNNNGKRAYCFYDSAWNWMDVKKENNFNLFKERPEVLDAIIFYAEKLSKPFPFVRVDFYATAKGILFGEMTFTPGTCIINDLKPTWQKRLGKLIELPLHEAKSQKRIKI